MSTNSKSGRWKLGLASWLVINGTLSTGYRALDLNAPVAAPVPLIDQSQINIMPEEIDLDPVQSSNNILQPMSLRCDSTAVGGTNPDQISLYIGNKLVWGPVNANAGTIANLTAVPAISFHNKVYVELYAHSKKLGSANVPSTGNGTLQFMYGNANYTLTYQVIPSSGSSD